MELQLLDENGNPTKSELEELELFHENWRKNQPYMYSDLPDFPNWIKRFIMLYQTLEVSDMAEITNTTEEIIGTVHRHITLMCNSAMKWMEKEEENNNNTQIGLCNKKGEIVQEPREPSIFDKQEEEYLFKNYQKNLTALNLLKGALEI